MGENENRKTSAGRKVLMIFGILFVAVAVFMGSFVFSFNLIINASNQQKMDDGSIEAENAKLKEDIQILEDKNKILEAEIDRYTGKSSSKSKSSSSRNQTDTEDEDSSDNSSSRSNDEEE